jgi:hypothetical protein
MKKVAFLLLSVVLFSSLQIKAATTAPARDFANPQLQMVGARQMALGGTNPVLNGDIGSVLINPAVVGSRDTMPLALSHKQILAEIDYQSVNFSFPFTIPFVWNDKIINQRCGIGLSYGSCVLDGVPETVRYNDRNWAIDYYSSGFNILAASLGTEIYDVLGFNTITLGVSGKTLRQFVMSESRIAFGLDIGCIATYYVDQYFVDKLHVGASVLNTFATSLVWDGGQGESYLPLDTLVGFRVDMLNDKLSLFAHNAISGFAFGTEYNLGDIFYLRGSSNLASLNLGTGMKFENITAFGNNEYSLRLDYSYSQNQYPYEDVPNNTISVCIVGETRPGDPKILLPEEDILTSNRLVKIGGVGPKNTAIRIYRNGALARTAISDKYGQWVYKEFPLKEGKNLIYLRAYSLAKDASYDSNQVLITLDTKPPDLFVVVYPEANSLVVDISVSSKNNDTLAKIEGLVAEKTLKFEMLKKQKVWRANIELPKGYENNTPVPNTMLDLKLFAEDQAGNQTGIIEMPFFFQVFSPKDKYVHYKEHVRVIGKSSQLTRKLLLNNNPIYIDHQMNFAISHALLPGKNLLKMTAKTLNDKEMTHTMRILRLVTFPDVTKDIKERREIEFLATLGILIGDKEGNFHPNEKVTRLFIAKMMVNVNGYELKPVDYDLFSDISKNNPDASYIQAAVENGLIFAYPDGSFKPNQALTLSEAFFLLSNAGIIEEQEVDDGDSLITRAQLAKNIAYLPRFELKIEYLIDWDKGYY